MTTRMATMFSRSAAPNLVRQFGDTITYHKNGGGTRSVSAMIERDVQVLTETGDVLVYDFVLRVEDDETTGITSTEIDAGTDVVSVPLRVGEAACRRQIIRVLSTENGLVRFAVQ